MFKALSLVSFFVIFFWSAERFAEARFISQINQQNSNPEQKSAPELGSPEEEILRRAEIRHSEDSHKDMVERADETAQMGDEILSAFKKNRALSKDELKKLEIMEKLARKIRGGAGGSDDDTPLNDPPVKLEAAVSRLAELSDRLKKNVQKTSRLVISASVIKNSNELVELIRFIRSFQKP